MTLPQATEEAAEEGTEVHEGCSAEWASGPPCTSYCLQWTLAGGVCCSMPCSAPHTQSDVQAHPRHDPWQWQKQP